MMERDPVALWVGLLGPLDVRVNDEEVAGVAGKLATVLAVLALSAGRPVSLEAVAHAVWSDRPPQRQRGSLQTLVLRLRRLIGPEVLRTTESGYVLDIDPDQVDVLRFRRLMAESTRREDTGQVRALLDEGLRLWRGEPLHGLRSDVLEEIEIPQLVEERLGALERRIEIDLATGRHAEVVAELHELISRHPLREPLWQRLIVALTRSHRQPEALRAYHELRVRLREELGIDPSAELQALQRSLVTGSSIDGGAMREPGPRLVVNQLPPDTEDYTGRIREVATLRGMLTDEKRRAVPVCVISGRAGIGKTALAVHIAHGLRAQFPDGQLHVSLRGTGKEPRDPADALDSLLRALGISGPAIPREVDARVELYRARLTGRRVLVVLDDAAGEWQVRPLLPGNASCAVLMTSRMSLAGLEGARRLELDLLETDEAVELLGKVCGAGRIAGEPAAAREIVSLCARLPLAVRIAGARLAARPHWQPAQLVNRLLDEQRRLDELVHGDLEVRASIALSHRGLGDIERVALRRLGMLHVPDFSAWVVAALLDVEAATAAELIERLRDVQLVEVCAVDGIGLQRFRLHDLVRIYARERALAEEPPGERRAALRRAFAGWCDLVETGEPRLGRGRRGWTGRAVPGWRLEAGVAGALLDDPLRWFDAERPALLGCVVQTYEEGFDDLACALATAMEPYFEVRASFDDWRHTHELVLGAARRAGAREAEGALLWALGDLHTVQDRYDEALACFGGARRAFEEAGDRRGVAAVLIGTGFALRLRGRFREALACFGQALATATKLDERQVRVDALHGLGTVHLDMDRLREASASYEAALAEARVIGYRLAEAVMLRALGHVALRARDRSVAAARLDVALTLSRSLSDRPAEAHVLLEMGELRRQEGRPSEARAIFEECLGLYRDFGNRFNEALTLRRLGELNREEGSWACAIERLTAAARIYDELRLPLWLSGTLRGLVAAHVAAGDRSAAAATQRRADALLEDWRRREGRRDDTKAG